MHETEEMDSEMDFDDVEEPSFSDPEDFEDDIDDQGKRRGKYPAFRPGASGLETSLWLADCYILYYNH